MKILKTITAAALLLMGTVVMAQQGQGNRQMRSATERAKTETERIVKAVELTADQTAKILVINQKYAVKDSIRFADMRNSQSSGNVDREAMMKEMKASRDVKTIEVKAVLTEDQKTKYDAYLKERDERGNRQGRQGGAQGNRPEGAPQGGQQ